MPCRNRCIGLRRGRDQSTSDCISCDDVTVVFCDVCPGFSLLFYIQLWCVPTFRCRKVGVFSCLDFLNLALSLGLWVTAPITVVLGAFCLILWISECFIQKMTDFPAGHPGWGAAPITSLTIRGSPPHPLQCSSRWVPKSSTVAAPFCRSQWTRTLEGPVELGQTQPPGFSSDARQNARILGKTFATNQPKTHNWMIIPQFIGDCPILTPI